MIWLRRRRVVVGKIIFQENRVFWFVVTPLRNWWGGFRLIIRKGIRYRKGSKHVWYNNNYNDIFVSFDFLKNQDSVEFLVEIYALHNLTYDLPYHLRLWLIFFTSWKFSANDFRSSIQFVYLQKKPKKLQKQKNETSLCSNFNCVCAVYYNISRCVKQFFELLNFMPLSYDEKFFFL